MPNDDDRTLRDAADLHVRSLHVREVREDAREADFICSTDAIDSYGEIVEQVWDLKRYLANPVVLYAHQSRDLPIGSARNVGVVDGALQATIHFSEAHQRAEEVWRLVKERTLRGLSVGFNPKTVRVEKRAGEEVVVLSDNELYELSVTPIPANADCLAKLRARALAAASHEPAASQGAPQPAPAAVAAPTTNRRSMMNQKAMEMLIAACKACSDECLRCAGICATGSPEECAAACKACLSACETCMSECAKLAGMEMAAVGAVEKAAAADALAAVVKERDAAAAALKAVEAERDAATAATESARAEAKAIGDRLLERDVDDLVGDKIDPAQRAEFIELAHTSRPLFDKMVAKLPSRKLLEPVIAAGAPAAANPAPVGAAHNGEDLAAAIDAASVSADLG